MTVMVFFSSCLLAFGRHLFLEHREGFRPTTSGEGRIGIGVKT
jgi:hypothetical protein